MNYKPKKGSESYSKDQIDIVPSNRERDIYFVFRFRRTSPLLAFFCLDIYSAIAFGVYLLKFEEEKRPIAIMMGFWLMALFKYLCWGRRWLW